MDELERCLAAARVADQAGDYDQVLEILESAPEGAEEVGLYFYVLGSACFRAGKEERAIAALERAVALEPDIAEYHGNLAAVLLDCVRRESISDGPVAHAHLARAISVLQRASHMGPRLPDVHCNLGLALRLAGQAGEALRAFGRALEIDPNHVPALYNRAAALRALGRDEECLAALDACLHVAPSHREAQASRKKILERLGRRG